MTLPFPIIRRALPADAPALALFAAQTFAEAFGPDNKPDDMAAYLAESFGAAQQHRELTDPGYVTLIVDGPEGIAAYAQVRRAMAPACVATPDPIELLRFYVDRQWRGRGLAQRLMDGVQAAAAELGGRSIWLGVWERNPRAIAFYVKCGFRDVGSATFVLGTDRQTDRILAAPVHDALMRKG